MAIHYKSFNQQFSFFAEYKIQIAAYYLTFIFWIGPPRIERQPRSVQRIDPSPLQRQHLRGLQPTEGRKLTGDPLTRRQHLPEAPPPTPT